MNRKQFLILMIALVVLGGAGLAVFWRDIAAYRASGAKIGGKLLPGFKIADVAQLRLKDSKHETALAKKGNIWVVEQRGGYPANFQALSDLAVKFAELKVTQSEAVGASLLPRLDLAEPGKKGGGTVVEFKDKGGKTLASLILGKTVLKKDPVNPLPSAQNGVPAGRYILVSGAKGGVVVVSDPLRAAVAAPEKWLSKNFYKADRIKTLAVGPKGAAPSWKITRKVEWGEWKFAGGGGELNSSAAVDAVNAYGDMSFVDVAPGVKAEDLKEPTVVTAETFDNLTYVVTLAKQKSGDDYYLRVTVSGEPPKERVPEKGEKPEDKAKRDKEFAETRKKLVARIAREQGLAKWTYLVAAKSVEPLLKERSQMVAQKKKKK